RRKPAYAAFRLPLVVTRLSRDSVEVWGCVRPASGPGRVSIFAGRRGQSSRLVARPRTNRQGYFLIHVRRCRAPRLIWSDSLTHLSSAGALSTYRSPTPAAGPRVHYSFR